MEFDMSRFRWINEPKTSAAAGGKIEIVTEPGTDFWQRTYYGFRNDNGHCLLFPTDADFTFSVKTTFDTKNMYDQCGIIVYQNSDNWFKASAEYEDQNIQRLGSVVTNSGYSDWATTDIDAGIKQMHYRLSRRGPDFRIENSPDGVRFAQMRIFHFFAGAGTIEFGVYACSPLKSSFTAVFTELSLGACIWRAHTPD